MNKKVILILPAYNAASTLKPFLRNLPKNIFAEIILIDDCSTDKTYELAKRSKQISVFQTPRNLGYGGNLKFCLGKALEKGAGIIIELHPDGEYDIDGIKPAIQKMKKGTKLVLGERKNLLSSGFPLWKYPFVKLSNFIDNLILGSSIVDLHQGFRVYSRELLERINFCAGSNNYIFSFEIIAQAIFRHLQIETVPVTVKYQGKKRGASLESSIIYTLSTFKVLFWLILARARIKNRLFIKPGGDAICPHCNLSYLVEERLKVNHYSLFFCKICQNAFTYPAPKDLAKFYPKTYWRPAGLLGVIKKSVFSLFQSRRKRWVESYLKKGNILDVGAGEGDFAKSLKNNFHVTSLEAPFAKIGNSQVLKQDFLSWKTSQRYDAVVFWESLEHVNNPIAFLKKAYQLLKKKGFLFVEYPRFASLEAKLFGKRWFHLDIPRHLFHFTDGGLDFIIRQSNFKKTVQKKVLSLDYAPWGLVVSLIKRKDFLIYHPVVFILLMPLILTAALVEAFFFVIGESPIGMMVAQKE